MTGWTRLLGVVGLSLWPAAAHAGLMTDFNAGSTDLTTNFAGNGQSLPVWSSAIGVEDQPGPSAGGGISAPAADFGNKQGVQQTGTSESFSSLNSILSVSAFFKVDTAPTNNPADARLLDLYLTEDTTTNLTGTGPGNAHAGVRLNTITNNTTYRLQTRNNNLTGATLSGGTFGLTLSNWYKMTVNFTNSNPGAGTIDLSVDIDDWGTSGTSFVSSLISGASATVTNTVLTNDSSTYSGFRIPRGINLSAMDNFDYAPVPEPTTLALLGLGSLAALRRRRGVQR